jgi:hypothetical protein
VSYEIDLRSVERQLPKGFRLPDSFRRFADACRKCRPGDLGYFAIKGGKPSELGFEVDGAIAPFIGLPDGGMVGFWFDRPAAPAVVHLGSEGERRLLALSWDQFLAKLAAGKTGVYDLDDHEAKTFPYALPKTADPALGAARKRFEKWMKAREPQPERFDAKAEEEIRAELFKVLGATRQLTESRAGAQLVVTYTSKKYQVDWYDFGLKPCPLAAALRPALTRLRDGVGRELLKSEISVWPEGRVFFEKNTELGKGKRRG